MKLKANLGCGENVVDGWINVDYSFGARFVKIPFFLLLNKRLKLFRTDWDKRILIHDLRKVLPFDDCSVEIIYTSHTLEHLTREEGVILLKECFCVMQQGGVLRVIVPDLEALVAKYDIGEIRADEFIDALGCLPPRLFQRGFRKLFAPVLVFPHKCMYDKNALCQVMEEAGFEAICKEPFESDIDDIERIEIKKRTHASVIVEGRKRSACNQ